MLLHIFLGIIIVLLSPIDCSAQYEKYKQNVEKNVAQFKEIKLLFARPRQILTKIKSSHFPNKNRIITCHGLLETEAFCFKDSFRITNYNLFSLGEHFRILSTF